MRRQSNGQEYSLISSQVQHTYTPTITTFSFSMATKIGTLNEENINRCYQLVSSLMVALCTEQASTIVQDRSMQTRRLRMDKSKTERICQEHNAQRISTLEYV